MDDWAWQQLFCACGRRLVTSDEFALQMCEWCQDAELQVMYEQGQLPEREED